MSYVQSGQSAVTAASTTITLNSVVATHSLLAFVRLSGGSDLITGVSSSINGAFTNIGNTLSLSATIRTYSFKLENVSAGNHVITFSASGSQTFRAAAAEYSENQVDALGAQATVASSGTPVSPSVTSTVAGDTIVTMVSVDSTGTITAGGSAVGRQTVNSGIQFQDQGASGAGVYSGTWTLGTPSASVAIAIAMKASILPAQPLVAGARQTFVNVIYEQY